MKIIEFIKKYQLILVLVFLIIILIILKLIYGGKDQNQISEPTIIPTQALIVTITPTMIPLKAAEISYEVMHDGNPDYPLIKLLPYSADNFEIIGYDEAYTLVVRIKTGTEEETEKEIKKWIEKNLPGDTNHKIIFTN